MSFSARARARRPRVVTGEEEDGGGVILLPEPPILLCVTAAASYVLCISCFCSQFSFVCAK